MDSTIKPQTREEILKASLDARIQEVMHYQINIDNYRIALEEISKMSDDERVMLAGFSDQLRTLMASEKLEQKKAQVMLTVLQKQVG
jgi:translation initiation factor 2B subunit (eIF-2B alpha/beta/delta family)